MMNEHRMLGAKPHKVDDRDWLWRDVPSVRARITGRKMWDMHGPEFRLNQGQEGTCVSHAGTHVLLDAPRLHEAYPPFATPETAHQWARALYLEASGDSTYQQGMYVRDLLDTLVKRGLISAYYRLASTDEAVDAVLTQSPVLWASPWYSSMDYPDTKLTAAYGNYYIRVNPDSTLRGYHAYALTAVDLAPVAGGPPYARMENSWGTSFGWGGTGRIPIDKLRMLYDGDAYILSEVKF